MPAYPLEATLAAGLELSSGRVVDILESDLVHPTQTDGLVNKGDPCYWEVDGSGPGAVGVALEDADLSTSHVPVQRHGVWTMLLDSDNGATDEATEIGELVFMTTAGVLNKDTTGTIIGRAMTAKSSSATPTVIPVLVGDSV